MTAILLYHVYPVNHWKKVTELLFQNLPFQKIVVHISLPGDEPDEKKGVEDFFKSYPVDEILYSENSGTGEVDALKQFVATQNLQGFEILTYMHCKGVTKPDNENIFAWTRLMHYFIIGKMNVCKKVFKKGFVTFGINKELPDSGDKGFISSNFYYQGNFVSINLKKIDLIKEVNHKLEETYYGVEGFWGKLCDYERGYSIFDSGINHYLLSVPEKDYSTHFGRIRYSLIKRYYNLKARFMGAKS